MNLPPHIGGETEEGPGFQTAAENTRVRLKIKIKLISQCFIVILKIYEHE